MPRNKKPRPARPTVRRTSISVGYCHPALVDSAFHTSLCLMLMRDKANLNMVDSIIGVHSGPRIATARNDIVRAFLNMESKPEWLFMLDTDMVFPPDVLEQVQELLSHPEEVPVVSGLAFIYSLIGEVKPNIMALNPEDGLPYTIWKYPPNTLCRVDCVGAAFLFIHRSVLEAIGEKYKDAPHPWFQETVWRDKEVGEDVTFSLRIAEAGFPLHVHTGLIPGHMKHTVIDEESYMAFRDAVDEKGAEAVKIDALARRHLTKREVLK